MKMYCLYLYAADRCHKQIEIGSRNIIYRLKCIIYTKYQFTIINNASIGKANPAPLDNTLLSL